MSSLSFPFSKKTHKRNKSIFDPASSKQGLPFSSSIFSYRKYRSLPDLSAFSQYPEETIKQPPLNHLDLLSSNQSSRQISHSRSTIISKEIEALESANQPPKQSKWKKKLESGSDNETKQQKIEKTSTPRSVVDIADGALSDSEVERVDRQRYENVCSLTRSSILLLSSTQTTANGTGANIHPSTEAKRSTPKQIRKTSLKRQSMAADGVGSDGEDLRLHKRREFI